MPDSRSCSLQMTDNDHQFCTMKWKLWSGYANEAGDQPLRSRKAPTSQIFMIFLRHTTGLFLLSQLKTQSYFCRCLNKIPNYRSHQIQTCQCLKQHHSKCHFTASQALQKRPDVRNASYPIPVHVSAEADRQFAAAVLSK